jgi:hypothetical protein
MRLTALILLSPPFGRPPLDGPYTVNAGQAYCPGPACTAGYPAGGPAGQSCAAGASGGQVTT